MINSTTDFFRLQYDKLDLISITGLNFIFPLMIIHNFTFQIEISNSIFRLIVVFFVKTNVEKY